MTMTFTDKRCSVDLHPTANGYFFEYGSKSSKKPSEEAVHTLRNLKPASK